MKVFISLVFVLCILATNLFAVPVEWKVEDGGNGHFYEPVSSAQHILWADARDAAVAADGYLCTITSEMENDFVYNLIADSPEMWAYDGTSSGPWLGATDELDEGNWKWVTDEPFDYSNWASGQPDNMANAEHWLQFYRTQLPTQWNDTGYPGDYVYSYIIEVPEPTTLMLIGLGGLVLRRKQ